MAGSKSFVINGDVGCGLPGSLSWHKCAVAEMTIVERIAYFEEVLPGMTQTDALSFMAFLVSETEKDGDST